MNNRSSYQPLLYALLICSGVVLGLLWNRFVNNDSLNADTKIEQVMGLVGSEYVDSISSNEIEDMAISELLSSFDPHSVYIPFQYVEVANQDLKGGFEGIGIEFFMYNDTPNVVRVLDQGPAMKAGFRPGDRIIKADTMVLIGLSNTDVVNALKGHKNTELAVVVYRPATHETFTKIIKRGSLKTPSVYSCMLNDNTLYVKIEHFAEKTHQEFVEQVTQHVKKAKVDNLILDLRNNPGGYLQTAISLLDELIDGQELLAFTKSKSDKSREYFSTKGGLCSGMKMVCLVNNRSASASEIVSGALQDLDKAVIIGSRTYGKGLVQETFQLKDGSQIRLTIARYYIPSGRSIQKPYDVDGYQTLDSIGLTEVGNTYRTKNGRMVKSEGGVTPDILLAEDSHDSYTYVSEVSAKLIDSYITAWSAMDSDSWVKLKSVNAKIYQQLGDSSHYFGAVKNRLVYQLYGVETAYKQSSTLDSAVTRALNEIRHPTVLLNP